MAIQASKNESLASHRARGSSFISLIAFALIALAACGGTESSDGERDRNISGGAVASQSAHPAPYQVGVFRFDARSIWLKRYGPLTNWPDLFGFACSGVILSPRWIATSSACVSMSGASWDKQLFRVGVGKVDAWESNNESNRATHMFGIEAAIHGGSYDNYALLKTDRPIDFAAFDSVRPIDLPFDLDDSWPAKGEVGTISGFGTKASGTGTVGTLRTAQVEVLADAADNQCGEWGNFNSEIRICLGKAPGPQGGLACNYDWGGPLVVNVEARPVLAGIISEIDRLGNCTSGGATLAIRMRSMVKWIAGGSIRDFAATPGDGAVTLSWSAPRAVWFVESEDPDWDPGVYDYVVEMSEDGGNTWFTVNDGANTSTEVTFSGLENGRSYAFRVAALNEVIGARAEYRFYSPVAKVTVGMQEEPVSVPPMPEPDLSELPPTPPTLAEQQPQGASDVVANPAQPASIPSTSVVPATTIAPATPSVAPTPGASATVSIRSTELSTFNPIGASEAAKLAKSSVPKGARVSVTVDKASKKVCTMKGSALVALRVGKCKVKVAVATGKGKPKSKTTTITVKK